MWRAFLFLFLLVIMTVFSWTFYIINKDPMTEYMNRWITQINTHVSGYAPNKSSSASRICSQEERKWHVDEMCRLYNFQWPEKPRMFVDDKHRLIFCDIGKTGSSTLKNLLHESMNNGKLRRQLYSPDLHNYTKLLLVRNPYARLVSAFNDKFVTHINETFPLYRKYRLQMAEFLGLKNEWKFEFKDFITYLETGDNSTIKHNAHWDQYSRCDPCHIKYDYILKTETLGEDIKSILPLIKQKYSVFKHRTARVSPEKLSDIWSGYRYSHNLTAFLDLSKEQIQWLQKEYHNEDVIFGYSLQEMTSYCNIQTASNEICC